jgi:ssDNA-binding Zn-finger/Zn-ribbon topoisomerase 1
MKLRFITGEFGKFIGCSGYPECNYWLNVHENIKCSSCGKPMEIRKGQYGRFLGCNGFPDCRFTINVIETKKKVPMIKLEMDVEEAILSMKRIQEILKNGWLNLDDIAAKLKIQDDADFKFLQMQLKKLEKQDKLDIKVIHKQKHWKLKS